MTFTPLQADLTALLLVVSVVVVQSAPTMHASATVPKGGAMLIAKPAVVTPPGVTLSWCAPTGAQYVITQSPDLQSWSVETNVPVTQTNVWLPMNGPQRFYRAYMVWPMTDGMFEVQQLNTITNPPTQ